MNITEEQLDEFKRRIARQTRETLNDYFTIPKNKAVELIALASQGLQLQQAEKEVVAVIELCPDAVRVCEGNGPENIYASLAVTVAKLCHSLEAAKRDTERLEAASKAWLLKLTNRPKIVCICGSSRFVDVSAVNAWQLNKQGVATFFMPLLPMWYPGVKEHHQAEAEGVAEKLDSLWLRLIEMADEILVINCDGYIGERTAIEIAHAEKIGKPVRYLEPCDHAINAERKEKL